MKCKMLCLFVCLFTLVCHCVKLSSSHLLTLI